VEDLRQVVVELPVAVYVSEAPSGVLRFYNRSAVALWGRAPALGSPRERFCGAWRLFHLDGRAMPHEETPMAEVLRTGQARQDEVLIERPDGSRVAARVDIVPLRDAGGRLVGAVNTVQDVTDRRRAEEALRLSEARYRAIVEDQPEMVCRFLADGTMTFANDAYCRYFGLRREALLGAPYVPVVFPDDLPHVQALVASMTPERPVVVIENRVIRGDGAVRWTEWTNRATYDEQGRLLEFQSTGRDITERRQAQADAARLAAIVASADDAIVGKTLDGVITSWNRAAERMFGYSAAEAIGQPIALVIPADRLAEEVEILDRLRRGDAIEHAETERVTRSGERLPVSLTLSPVRDASGRIIGASSIARDTSERRRAEGELRAKVQTLEVLYRLVDLVGRAEGPDQVCEAGVEAILAAAGADRASILLFDEGGVMRFRAWRRLSPGYRAAVDGHSPWSRDVRDPAPIVVEDVLADPALAAFREVIAAEGIRALGFIPLHCCPSYGRPIG
jgi:PAS domain S-box-containing protein